MSSKAAELCAAPPFLLGAGLLLWGWQNGFILYAVPMALLLELAHWIEWRWSVTDKEFNNLTDLSGVGFFITFVYIFNENGAGGIYVILSILPFVLFLITLAQIYSIKGKIKLSALFIRLRRMEKKRPTLEQNEIDLTLPYFLVSLLSASAGNQRTIWFFIFCCLMIGIVLGRVRPARGKFLSWFALLVLSFSMAYGGQIGIRNIQAAIERQFMGVFDHYMWRYRDPLRATTAIGMIGRLKFSDRILVRIKTDAELTSPIYLREATYSNYGYGIWSAGSTNFTLIEPDIEGINWSLGPAEPSRNAKISTYMVKEKGVIPLPLGTSRINGTGIIQIDQNPYGAVNMEIREGWVSYNAGYRDNLVSDAPPDENDLQITPGYKEDFDRLTDELQLHNKSDQEIIRIVEDFFSTNFYYSMTRRQRFPRGRYLYDFLFQSRRGHCEYFATSTVLLLRSAGIPARYAVGYSTREYSPLEGQYVARSRHAHSWVMAYVDNNWEMIDTTPAVWAPMEDDMASDLQFIIDLYSWVRYRYEVWQTGDVLEESEETGSRLLWLLIPLLAILIWRLYYKERVHRGKDHDRDKERLYPGLDSRFYSLVELLESNGYQRYPGETLRRWLARIEPDLSGLKISESQELHYRYRFDPEGLSQKAQQSLDELVSRDLLILKAGL